MKKIKKIISYFFGIGDSVSHTSRYSRDKGFTLLEILIVMGILIIISTIGFSIYTGYHMNVEADEEINKIRSVLRNAQGRAIAFEQNSQWGVRFSNPISGDSIFELFEGSSYPGIIRETIYLSSRFIFVTPSVGMVQDIIFEKRSGKSTNTSTITISIKPRGSALPIMNVTITQEGKIE